MPIAGNTPVGLAAPPYYTLVRSLKTPAEDDPIDPTHPAVSASFSAFGFSEILFYWVAGKGVGILDTITVHVLTRDLQNGKWNRSDPINMRPLELKRYKVDGNDMCYLRIEAVNTEASADFYTAGVV